MFDEKKCLSADPFAGDFGEPDDRTLRDKIVVARKAGPCHDCAQTIKPGERVRSRSDIFDGQMMSFRWCEKCCEAMALSWEDGGKAWEERNGLRHASANARLTGGSAASDSNA